MCMYRHVNLFHLKQSIMKIKYLQKTLLLLVLLMLSINIFAQTPQQRENLRNLSRELRETYERERQEAIRWADSLGIPMRQVIDGVAVIELMRIVDDRPVYYTTHNLEGAGVINSSEVWDGGNAGLSLSGEGQRLGIWDAGGVLTLHVEFLSNGTTSRVTQQDDPSGTDWHATHVAGTMIAEGEVDDAKGMSYEANLDAYDWNDDTPDMADAALDELRVSNHSYGTASGWIYNSNNLWWYWYGDTSISETEDHNFGRYNSKSRDWDETAYNAPHYLIVKSAGNYRGRGPSEGELHLVHDGGGWVTSTVTRDLNGGDDGYNSIPTFGNAKNIMTVGNVNVNGVLHGSSSSGPTDDGRIKPDIVAKGVGVRSTDDDSDFSYETLTGTSMSSPMISGSVGLLLEHQENLHGEQNPMLASTMKALILHTAQEMGDHPGPDYGYGWGMMDTQRAAELMSEDALAGGEYHIRELTLDNGQTKEIDVIADGFEPLKVTIVWNDPEGEPVNDPDEPNIPDLMLVNDLDMRITNNPTVYEPWVLDPDNPSSDATTGDNFRDNVEQILVEDPEVNDVYTITIDHKDTLEGGSQDFSLIVTGIREEPLAIPLSNWALYLGILLMTTFVVIRFRNLI